MSKMRVALWSTSFFRGFGGAEKVVSELANYLSRANLETFIIGNQPGGSINSLPHLAQLDSKIHLYGDTFPNPLLNSHRPFMFLFELVQYLKASVSVFFFFQKNRFEVVHLHLVNIDVLLLILFKQIFNFHLVLTFTGMELEFADTSRFSRLKLKLALKSADKVTAVSRDICSRLQANFQFPAAIYIQNGVDVGRIDRPAVYGSMEIEEGHFVYCGRLSAVKRVSFLLSAFKQCLESGCQQFLYVIGDGEEADRLKALVREYGISDRVIMLGTLPHCQTLRVMSRSRCLVLSSTNEACPMVVLEAMALGKPVIAPDVGGLRDLVKHGRNGYLFPVNDLNSMSRFMLTLGQNKVHARELGGRGAAKIKDRFAFNDVAEKYMDLYHEIVGQL